MADQMSMMMQQRQNLQNQQNPQQGQMQMMQQQMQQRMQQQQMQNRGYPGAPGSGGLAQAGPGGLAGIGGPAQDNGPADLRSPEGAVRAFLSALHAKDRDRLAEATASRSQREALIEITDGTTKDRSKTTAVAAQKDTGNSKNQEMFAKIVDSSISDSELDEVGKRLEGYQIAGENAVKSTGRLGIYIDKLAENGSVLRRTVTVRKEKKGWGVMDISPPTEFKPAGAPLRRRSGRGR
jgi:hypothetical protein